MVISLTLGTHPAAINNGGVVPSFITKHLALMFKLQGYCHDAIMGFAIFVINEDIYNHPLKKFAIEE